MGTVYRKTVTKALPSDAKVIVRKGKRLARWQDSKGKSRSADVTTGRDGSDRIVIKARTFTAKHRDGHGWVVETATGCKDETAARSVLSELERRADRLRSGMRTAAEDETVDHQNTPLDRHFVAYTAHLEAAAVTVGRINTTTLTGHFFIKSIDFLWGRLRYWRVWPVFSLPITWGGCHFLFF